jgi:hypothetical protein
MDVADLFVVLTISKQPIAGSIIVSARRECVLAGVRIVNEPNRSAQTMTQGYIVRFCYFGLVWVEAAHISYAPSLSFDILDKWNINNPSSTSCVRSDHVMVFLIFFSVLVCPG